MRIRWLDALVLAYGILLIAMGWYGTAVSANHEIASAIAGSVAGILEFGFLYYSFKNPRVGRIGSSVVALLLVVQSGMEVVKTHKITFMIICASSILVCGCLVGGHIFAMSKRKARTT